MLKLRKLVTYYENTLKEIEGYPIKNVTDSEGPT